MCITFLFTNPFDKSQKYKLILINNRDEFFARLTLKAEIKENHESLKTIYGTDIDAIEHGTWLGLSQNNRTIKIGNLLNVTGETKKHGVQGRGSIALDYIKSSETIEEHNRKLLAAGNKFNGFNFLSIEIKTNDLKIFNVCNVSKRLEKLPMGYFGGSNSPICSPYQKVTNGTQKFKQIIESHKYEEKETLINSFMNLLKCEAKHLPCAELNKRRPYDAHVFSSIHVKHTEAQYGTRNRSVILVDHHHNVDYVEERMVNENPDEPIWERQNLKIYGFRKESRGILDFLITKRKFLGRLRAML